MNQTSFEFEKRVSVERVCSNDAGSMFFTLSETFCPCFRVSGRIVNKDPRYYKRTFIHILPMIEVYTDRGFVVIKDLKPGDVLCNYEGDKNG